MDGELHSKIYDAKKILLKQTELNGKTFTLSSLEEDFDLSTKGFLGLVKDGAISIENCILPATYIHEYNQQFKKGLDKTGSYHKAENSLKRIDCGLGMKTYQELLDKGEAAVNILDYAKYIDDPPSPLEHIKFKIQITPKLQDFLNKKLDLFIRDELDLSIVAIQQFYDYKTQKRQFSTAIQRQINAGFSPKNLKVNFTEVWSKEVVIMTNFIETALAMEREGLIGIKDIIEDDVYKPLMPSHELKSLLAWEHPTTIHLSVLSAFFAPQVIKSKIDKCTDDEIKNIKDILDVINIRLSYNRPPYIVYIPLVDFPDSMKRYEVIALLYKIDRDLGGAFGFTQITDRAAYEKQEVCIRVEDNKVKFTTFKQAIDEKYQKISEKSQPQKSNKEPAEMKEKDKKENLFPVPKNTQWKDLTIKFKNDFDVEIAIGKNKYSTDYEKMQFADKRIKKSKEKAKATDSWKMLCVLSTSKGVFPLDQLIGKEKTQKIKQKQALAKGLTNLFPSIAELDDDPFFPYDDIQKIYKIKINLIPVETFREDFRDKDIKDESDDKLGIKDYYNQMTDNK